MDHSQTTDQFRTRLRSWLEENAPPPGTLPAPGTPAMVAAAQDLAQRMFDAGFNGVTWPAEYGGQGLGPGAAVAYSEEVSRFVLPLAVFGVGWGMCGPTILDLGTPEQRERYIEPMLQGREIWSQLFSEPDAGSDVAALRTRAVQDGDDWVVTGQKIWTTGAQHSDFAILLARTNADAPKHKGLTMFVLDMRAPGVLVRPLRDMTGHEKFNEVFLDGVRLPSTSVVGEVDRGWDAARTLLLHERLAVSHGFGVDGEAAGPLSFGGLARAARAAGVAAAGAAELVDLFLSEHSIELFNSRIAREAAAGRDPGPRGSVGKLLKARRDQTAAILATRLLGVEGVVDREGDEGMTHAILKSPELSIGGGTNEIQLSIIGERVLGLPREPNLSSAAPGRPAPVAAGGTS